MEVYGEGIEDESQRMRLRRNGCDIGQGYLFARPLPAEDAAAYLRGQAERIAAYGGDTLHPAANAPAV